MSKKPIIYKIVKNEYGGVCILQGSFPREEGNLIGESTSWREAKRLAIESAQITIDNYRYDLDSARDNLKELRSLKKPK